MKLPKNKIAVLIGILIFVLLYWSPFVQKKICPEHYWEKQIKIIQQRILKLEHRVAQQKAKIELKESKLRRYRRDNSSDLDFSSQVEAKQDLIEILESVQSKTIESLDRQRGALEFAQVES